MNSRRICIGDVHGHYNALVKLLENIAPSQTDEIYFLGDLIDRGPQSAQVVELVIKNQFNSLRGNHEELLLFSLANGEIDRDFFRNWLHCGGTTTLASYKNGIPYEHIRWLKKLPLYLDLGDLFLVHAGLNPHLPLEEQTSEDCCWIRNEFHRISQPYFPDKLVVTGHTITFTLPGITPGKIATGKGWLDIDTGVYHSKSGWLSGVDFSNNLVYQVHSRSLQFRKVPLAKAIRRVKF